MVVMVGVDVHKDTHCAVMVNEVGRQKGSSKTVRATDLGHLELVRWATQSAGGQQVLFAVEDCRHVSTRLERALLNAGLTVLRVPPKLMAGARSSARTRGKSDPIDALAIGRAALREPDLPRAEHTHVSRDLRLLVDHRDRLVNTRTRHTNLLRWHLHELDPELNIPARGAHRLRALDRIQLFLEQQPAVVLIRVAGELVADIRSLTCRITVLDKDIADLVKAQAPQLLSIDGCGYLTAPKLAGETANPHRFRSEACFAMHAGVAPIPASSGRTNRHRLARGGNRQMNAAIHRIAITQIRIDGPGRVYYQRRRSQGDTSMQAIRALKRHIARAIYQQLTQPTDTFVAAS
jgi:transposase